MCCKGSKAPLLRNTGSGLSSMRCGNHGLWGDGRLIVQAHLISLLVRINEAGWLISARRTNYRLTWYICMWVADQAGWTSGPWRGLASTAIEGAFWPFSSTAIGPDTHGSSRREHIRAESLRSGSPCTSPEVAFIDFN
jgi:hypothetical protein